MKDIKKTTILILSVLLAFSLVFLCGCDIEIGGGALFDISAIIERNGGGSAEDSSSEDPESYSDIISSDDIASATGSSSEIFSQEGSSDPIEDGSSSEPDQSEDAEIDDDKIVSVTFKAGKGYETIVSEGKAGDPIDLPVDPVREGYAFRGWESGGEKFELEVFPETDLILNAIWVRFVSVAFYPDNGTQGSVVEGAPGDPIDLPVDPVREGFAFGGWQSGGEKIELEVFPETDLILNAIWDRLIKVTFEPENGSQKTVVKGLAGDLIVAPVDPVRDGYAFVGWSLDGQPFDLFFFPESDITVYAVWSGTVTVHFDTGTSDVVVNDRTITYGESITEPVVSRSGFLLRRWSYRGAAFDFESPITSDMTLTAEWLERTNLPTMSIDLFKENGSSFNVTDITREAYVSSTITLSDGDGNLELDKFASQTKGRGNGSWTEANGGRGKCGFKLKLDKKESLFGRAKNKHWVLLACINFDDVTMCRNYSAFNLAGEVFDNLEYSTNAVWLDLYINGEYRGVYLLCEHVRVASGRVDIDSEYGVLDTGYLVEYDAYAPDGGMRKGVDYFSINESGGVVNNGGSRSDLVKYGFTMHSPSPEDYETEGLITEEQYREQVSFIQDYVKRTYSSIIKDNNFTTFASLADVDSFVDMYILQELYKNKDAGFSSFFLYKKPGGKLYLGAPWDFDGSTNSEGRSATGIFIADGSRNSYSYWNGSSELFVSLYANAQFKALVVERWKQISPLISAYYNDLFTEEFYSKYGDAMAKNFYRWKSGGSNSSVESARSTWISNTRTLVNWFKDRISYLNGEWK